jgi:ribosomal protein L7/L12
MQSNASLTTDKQPDLLYDQLMSYEIGFDEFVEARKQERLKGNTPMKLKPTPAEELVAAAKRSQGLTAGDVSSPEYAASLEADAVQQSEKVVDAEFTELAEANALNADDTRKLDAKRKEGLFDRIWFTQGPPPQDVTEMGIFQLAGEELAHMGKQIVEDVKGLGTKTSNLWIAAGAQLDTWRKAMTVWSNAELVQLSERYKEYKLQVRKSGELWKAERRVTKHVPLIVFEEYMDAMVEQHEKLRNEFVGRITALEKTVKTGVAPAPAPDYSKLDLLLDCIADGKLINAVKLYREIKPCTLAQAKMQIERLVVAA